MRPVAIAGDISPSLNQVSSTSRSAHQGSRSSSTRDSKMSKKKSDNRKANKVTKPSLGNVVKQGKSERVTSRVVEHLWHPDRPWDPFKAVPAFSDHGADTSDVECRRNTNSSRNVTQQTSQDARGS